MISVLAVDDNDAHCYAMSRLLERSGFRVQSVQSGLEALQIVKTHKPDIVLLDVNLPDIHGFEVCSMLRQDPDTKEIPVVFHTAVSANEPTRSHALSVGADAFLTYPVDREHLVSVIQGCVARHSKTRRD